MKQLGLSGGHSGISLGQSNNETTLPVLGFGTLEASLRHWIKSAIDVQMLDVLHP